MEVNRVFVGILMIERLSRSSKEYLSLMKQISWNRWLDCLVRIYF